MRHALFTLVLIVVRAQPARSVAQDGRAFTMCPPRPGLLQPGSVVLLTVKSSTPVAELTGQAFGRAVRFWQQEPLEWRALVAADLEAKPGAYDVRSAWRRRVRRYGRRQDDADGRREAIRDQTPHASAMSS